MSKSKVTIEQAVDKIVDNYDLYHTPYGVCYMRKKSSKHSLPMLINPANVSLVAYKTTRYTFQNRQTGILFEMLKENAKDIGVLCDVYTRIAFHEDTIHVNLGSNGIVIISKDEIKIAKRSPVLFRRPTGMQDLPKPIFDDDAKPFKVFKKFFQITNFNKEDWRLAVAYIMAAFYKEGTKPILLIEGPHGSGKSSSLEILLRLLDPYAQQFPGLDTTVEGLFIYAQNRVFAGFDNVSEFRPNISDALCRIATGGSLTKRKQYTDDDEHVIPARALLALNGISPGMNRPDLLDRTLKLEFSPLQGQHRPITELMPHVAAIHPRVLGWLFRAVQYGLRHPKPLPTDIQTGRLADFALWTYRWAPALNLNPDRLVDAIYRNQKGSQAEAISTDTCATFIFYLLDEHDDKWKGTPADLFEELNHWIDERRGGLRRKGEYPVAVNTLHGWLKRAAPLLKTAGVECNNVKRGGRRLILLTRTSQVD